MHPNVYIKVLLPKYWSGLIVWVIILISVGSWLQRSPNKIKDKSDHASTQEPLSEHQDQTGPIAEYSLGVTQVNPHHLRYDTRLANPQLPWIVICAASRSLKSWSSIYETSLVRFMIPSIVRYVSDADLLRWRVAIYIGVDNDDEFWRVHHSKINTSKDISIRFFYIYT